MKLAAVLLVASCAGPRFLGEPLPSACTSVYSQCEAQLGLAALRDDYAIGDVVLQRYVERVAARVVKASRVDYVPTVVILELGEAEVRGRQIVIGRPLLAALASEAQLAGVIAHETAHLEAHDTETTGEAIDAEAIADERAVALLARAGYPTDGISRALTRLDDGEQAPNHPPMPVRIQRTKLLADLTPGDGDEGRAAYLRAIDGLPAGSPRERGARVGDAWIVADRDVALPIPATASVEESPIMLVMMRDDLRFQATPVGVRVAADAVTAMREIEHRRFAIGDVTIGRGLPERDAPAGSLAKLVASMHSTVDEDKVGAIVPRPGGAMILTVDGPNAAAELRAWLRGLRVPTAEETARATSPRIKIATVAHAGPIRELVTTCANPVAALALDDPDRVLATGELFKCTDR